MKKALKQILGIFATILGFAVGSYSGIHFLIPFACTIGFWLLLKAVTPEAKAFLIPAVSVQAGHLSWMVIGVIILGSFVQSGPDIIVIAVGLFWLFFKPSLWPCALLLSFQVFATLYNSYTFINTPIGSAMSKGLMAHLAFRVAALFFLVQVMLQIKSTKRTQQNAP